MEDNCAYSETFNNFLDIPSSEIINKLKSSISDPGESQIKAWQESIDILKKEIKYLLEKYPHSFLSLKYYH